MTFFLAGLFLSALTGGIIIPQISSFLLILETDDFDSINSDNPYELPEQELLTRSASLVRGVRSHQVLQSVPQSTVSQPSFSLPVAEAIASVERLEINSPCHGEPLFWACSKTAIVSDLNATWCD